MPCRISSSVTERPAYSASQGILLHESRVQPIGQRPVALAGQLVPTEQRRAHSASLLESGTRKLVLTEQRTSRPTGLPGRRAWALWRGRGRRTWEAARWLVIGGLFLAALVLGWIGFDLNSRALGQPGSFTDNLYRSLQLFIIHSGAAAPPVSWQLEVARFLAPAVAAGATLSALATLLGEQLAAARVRFYSCLLYTSDAAD